MRTSLLILGPPVLVSLSYWLAIGSLHERHKAETVIGSGRTYAEIGSETEGKNIEAACRQAERHLKLELGGRFHTLVRPPYVVAGDFPLVQLEQCYSSVIRPVERALQASYFDRPPDEPIVVVLCSTEASYRECASRLDAHVPDSQYGYYRRDKRRIVANLATGYGTLAHELTHALAHFDFPQMPEWFDEGLAALHEQARFTDNGLRLKGLPNWRVNVVLQALEQGRLEPIASFVARPSLRRERTAADYAYARYFCLYLQHHRLLEPFYRKFRFAAAHDQDPTGLPTLKRLLAVESAEEIDLRFRAWLRSLRLR